MILAVPDRELTPGYLGDVTVAAELAANVAAMSRADFVVGPISVNSLRNAGVELPDQVEEREGPTHREAWILEHAEPADLIVLPVTRQPSGVIDRLAAVGLSAVATARNWQDRSLSSDGALGVASRPPQRADANAVAEF